MSVGVQSRHAKGGPAGGSALSRRVEPFRLPLTVYYEDTDAAGVVYYANYLKFMERARTEWLGSLGFAVADFEAAHGVVFVVHRMEIDYRLPGRLGDRLEATLDLCRVSHVASHAAQASRAGAGQRLVQLFTAPPDDDHLRALEHSRYRVVVAAGDRPVVEEEAVREPR